MELQLRLPKFHTNYEEKIEDGQNPIKASIKPYMIFS
jgi:hypothetical protein